MIWASWARCLSSQKTAGAPVARARLTASLTQSRIGQVLGLAAAPDVARPPRGAAMSTLPAASTTRMVPSPGALKVLSWEPYSSAFWAMRPTLATQPMVVGSKAPCFLQKSMASW